jgi:hypothetical protein
VDEKLLRRVQASGALMVAIAYFLPWASIMSPLGSVELRGLYIDYTWILLVLAILHLLLQFARLNRDALGLPDSSLRSIEVAWRLMPLVFIAFFAWYGASFGFNAHNASPGQPAIVFGTSVDSIVKAGLDYGYCIGLCGAVLLTASIGLVSKQMQFFIGYGEVVALATVGLAFGFSRPGKQVQQTGTRVSLAGSASVTRASVDAPAPTNPTEPDFDSSPYVQLTSISARRLAKDYDANRYRNSVVISPVFKNVGSRAIVGLRGRLSVIDGFGNEVYGFNFRDDDKMLPGHDSGRGGGYSFEENQFQDDDPYHKMVPLIDAGTAKYTARVARIAFDDGTVLPKK